MNKHRVVVVGGGFGGLHVARRLKGAAVSLTLVDKRNFHLFQPLLYQVATGGLSPANITAPLRSVLKGHRNTKVLMGAVTDIDPESRQIALNGTRIEYDTLVLATGARNFYFGHADWTKHAPGLKTVEDALEVRRRILSAFEFAERETDPAKIKSLLTFVIVGAGPTGVELAGAFSEIANHTLRREFTTINPSHARIILIERGPRLLSAYPSELSRKAEAALGRLGVSLRMNTAVTAITDDAVTLETDGFSEQILTRNVIWAAGVEASSLGKILADKAKAELDRGGRVVVQPDMTVPGHPEIFVIGDLANCKGVNGQPLPGVAPVAIQQGRYVAKLICRRLKGEKLPPFRYRDYGSLATIGRSAAVAEFGKLRFGGFLAWLLWLFIHLMSIVQFQNRLLVFVQWTYSYLTWNRSARLITGDGETE